MCFCANFSSASVLYKVAGYYEDGTEAANLNRCVSATTKSARDGEKQEGFFSSPPTPFANKR